MDLQTFSQYIAQYGTIVVFVVVFLEYLNLPGFPAGVIMPAAGLIAAQGRLNFPLILLLSILAGLLGSWCLYGLGRLGGAMYLDKLLAKFPKREPGIRKTIDYVQEKGYPGLLIAKLIPAVRTLISIPAGVFNMNFWGYTVFSALGIAIWNLVFIGAGYLFGEQAIAALALR